MIKALATDFDGTLAHDGIVKEETVAAMKRWAASGRTLVMVTGRELPDLEKVYPGLQIFDRLVLENGALLVNPRTGEVKRLAPPPPPEFARELERRGVTPLSVGHVIVATREPYEAVVLQVIREMGLELEIIFNKGAVMVLPSGVNKATGLRKTLADLGIDPADTVGVGDAENDHSFLTICGLGVAVANAIPSLKEKADWVTEHARGDGVVELLDRLLLDDLAGVRRKVTATG